MSNSGKYCFVYIQASHYRKELFECFDKNLECDFVVGRQIGDIKVMDMSQFRNAVFYVTNRMKGDTVFWQSGVLSFVFKQYKAFYITGDPHCLSTWLFLLIGRLLRKKITIGTHGLYGKESIRQKRIKCFMYSLAYNIVVYNNYSKRLLLKEGFADNRVFVHNNSLDYSEQIKLRHLNLSDSIYRNHFRNNNPVLIFIGRLTRVKQLHIALQAIKLLNSKGYPFNLVFVGDGTERDHLETLTKEMHLTDLVWFYGACYNQRENAVLIHNAEICIAPGNVGLTAMHVMMYGTPVITHDNFPLQMPEFEAIVPSKTGAFFKYGEAGSLADTILSWCVNHPDRETVRKECYHEIDTNWTTEVHYSRIVEALNS